MFNRAIEIHRDIILQLKIIPIPEQRHRMIVLVWYLNNKILNYLKLDSFCSCTPNNCLHSYFNANKYSLRKKLHSSFGGRRMRDRKNLMRAVRRAGYQMLDRESAKHWEGKRGREGNSCALQELPPFRRNLKNCNGKKYQAEEKRFVCKAKCILRNL